MFFSDQHLMLTRIRLCSIGVLSRIRVLDPQVSDLGITLQRQNAENLKQIFPEKDNRGLSPNFHIHVSVSELYIPTMGLPFLLEEIFGRSWEYINRSQTHECGNWG
jgi:hypothetical protein